MMLFWSEDLAHEFAEDRVINRVSAFLIETSTLLLKERAVDWEWQCLIAEPPCEECRVPIERGEYCYYLGARTRNSEDGVLDDYEAMLCLDCAYHWYIVYSDCPSIDPPPPILTDPERNPWLTTKTSIDQL